MSDSYTAPDTSTMNVPPAQAEDSVQTASEAPEVPGQADTVNTDAEVIDVEILEQEQQARSYEVHQEGALTYFQYFLEDDNDVINPGGYGSWRPDSDPSPRSFISVGAVGVGVLAATFGAGLLVAEATNQSTSNEASGNAIEQLSQDSDGTLDAGGAAATAQGSTPESLTPDWSNSQAFLKPEKAGTIPGTDSGSPLSGSMDLGETAARIAAAKAEIANPAASSATAMMAPMATSPLISRPSRSLTALAMSPAMALVRPSAATLAALPTPVTTPPPTPFPAPSRGPSTWTQGEPSPQPAVLPDAPSRPPSRPPSQPIVAGAEGSGSPAQVGSNGGALSADEQALRDRLTALREREAMSGSATSYQRPVSREDLATPKAAQGASGLAPAQGTTLDNLFGESGELSGPTAAQSPSRTTPLTRPVLSSTGTASAVEVNNVAAPVAGLLPVSLQAGDQQLSPTSRRSMSPSLVAPPQGGPQGSDAPQAGAQGPRAGAYRLTRPGSANAPEYSPAIELSVIPAEARAQPWPLISSLEQLRLEAKTRPGNAPPAGLSRQVAAAASQNPAQLSPFRLVSLPMEDYRQLWQRSLLEQDLEDTGPSTASPQAELALGDRPTPAHGFVDYQNRFIVLVSPPRSSATNTAEESERTRPGTLAERGLELASNRSL